MDDEELVELSPKQAEETRSLLDEMRKRVPMSKKRRAELDEAIRALDEAIAEAELAQNEPGL